MINPVARATNFPTFSALRELQRRITQLESQLAMLIRNNTIVISSDIPRVTSLLSADVTSGQAALVQFDRGAVKGDILYAWGQKSTGAWDFVQVVKWPSVV